MFKSTHIPFGQQHKCVILHLYWCFFVGLGLFGCWTSHFEPNSVMSVHRGLPCLIQTINASIPSPIKVIKSLPGCSIWAGHRWVCVDESRIGLSEDIKPGLIISFLPNLMGGECHRLFDLGKSLRKWFQSHKATSQESRSTTQEITPAEDEHVIWFNACKMWKDSSFCWDYFVNVLTNLNFG